MPNVNPWIEDPVAWRATLASLAAWVSRNGFGDVHGGLMDPEHRCRFGFDALSPRCFMLARVFMEERGGGTSHALALAEAFGAAEKAARAVVLSEIESLVI